MLPALVLVINPILQYTIFEQLKDALEKRRGRAVLPWDAFILGAIGKLLATAITYPYITVKSRMHVASRKDSSSTVQDDSMSGSLRRVVREEGWGGLYKGTPMPLSFLVASRYKNGSAALSLFLTPSYPSQQSNKHTKNPA